MAKRATRAELSNALKDTDIALRCLRSYLLEVIGEEFDARQMRLIREMCCRRNQSS